VARRRVQRPGETQEHRHAAQRVQDHQQGDERLAERPPDHGYPSPARPGSPAACPGRSPTSTLPTAPSRWATRRRRAPSISTQRPPPPGRPGQGGTGQGVAGTGHDDGTVEGSARAVHLRYAPAADSDGPVPMGSLAPTSPNVGGVACKRSGRPGRESQGHGSTSVLGQRAGTATGWQMPDAGPARPTGSPGQLRGRHVRARPSGGARHGRARPRRDRPRPPPRRAPGDGLVATGVAVADGPSRPLAAGSRAAGHDRRSRRRCARCRYGS
jgi:hypothetical protein